MSVAWTLFSSMVTNNFSDFYFLDHRYRICWIGVFLEHLWYVGIRGRWEVGEHVHPLAEYIKGRSEVDLANESSC